MNAIAGIPSPGQFLPPILLLGNSFFSVYKTLKSPMLWML